MSSYREEGVWTALGIRHEDEDGEITWTLERREGYIASSADFVCPFTAVATRKDAEELLLWQVYAGDTPVKDVDLDAFNRWCDSHHTPSIEWED